MITLRDINSAIDDIREHGETDVFAHRDEVDYLLMPDILPQTIATVRQMDKDILMLSCEEFVAKYVIINIHSSQFKRCGGVREITLIDSMLNIYYLSLAISIERKYGRKLYFHPTKGLFADVFQNRNGYARYAYHNFKRETKQILERRMSEYSMLISMDIRDCYGSISETLIRESCNIWAIDSVSTEKLLRLLQMVGSRGLPVGGNASRMIAEFIFCRVDSFLHCRGVSFCRYADDYFLFMPIGKDPIELFNIIDNHIKEVGLSINNQKLKAFAIDFEYLFCLPAMDISEELDDKTEKYKNN